MSQAGPEKRRIKAMCELSQAPARLCPGPGAAWRPGHQASRELEGAMLSHAQTLAPSLHQGPPGGPQEPPTVEGLDMWWVSYFLTNTSSPGPEMGVLPQVSYLGGCGGEGRDRKSLRPQKQRPRPHRIESPPTVIESPLTGASPHGSGDFTHRSKVSARPPTEAGVSGPCRRLCL